MMKEKQKPKHERNLLKKKIGYFQSEQEQFAIIKNNTGTQMCIRDRSMAIPRTSMTLTI